MEQIQIQRETLLFVALPVAVALSAVAAFLYHRHAASANGKTRLLPPGPKTEFLLGNARQMPSDQPWLWYTELKEKHGEIVALQVPGKTIIILNSISACQDLLMRKGRLYSDRNPWVMGDLMGLLDSAFMSPWGDLWRAQRQLWKNHLGPHKIPPYHDMIETTSMQMMLELQQSSESNAPYGTINAFKLKTIRLLSKLSYGLEVNSLDDELVKMSDNTIFQMLDALTPGKYLCELLPFLKYIPTFFPGADFKKKGLRLRSELDAMIAPYRQLRKDHSQMKPLPQCISTDMLQANSTGLMGTELAQIWIAGSVYAAGVDTSTGVFDRFVLAMTLYPEVQKRAQQEIDGVIGASDIPTLDDRNSLPYLDALLKECYRWKQLAPISVPRRLTEDDIYKGYLLPKGSLIIPNHWAVSHDESLYPNPEVFDPERFLGDNPALDSRTFVFGHGRRSCPGKEFADTAIFSTAALLLSMFTIEKVMEGGIEEIKFHGGFVNEMHKFPHAIRLRSPERLAHVRDYLTKH